MSQEPNDRNYESDESKRVCAIAQKVVRRAYRTLSVLVAVMLLLMMILAIGDVVGRYLFNSPLKGASEVIELMLGTVVFSALPLVTLRQEHVTIDLLTGAFRGKAEVSQRALIELLAAACYFVLAYNMWFHAEFMRQSNDITHVLRIPIFPVPYAMSMVLAVSGVCAVLCATGMRVKESAASPVDSAHV